MNRYLKLCIVGLGASTSFLDSSVNVAFPAIARRFGLEQPDIVWLVVAFALTSVSLMLRFGRLGDRIGHGFVFRFGLALSVVAFSADALAASYPHLLLARVFQGVGTAAIVSCALALARDLFDPSERAKVIGYYVLMISFAGALGPVVGGAMLEWLGWSGVFSFRVVIAAVAWTLAFALPSDRRPGTGHMLGAVGAFVAAAAILVSVSFLSDSDDRIFGLVVLLLAGLGLLGATDLLRLLRAGTALFASPALSGFAAFVGAIFRAVAVHFSAFSVMLLVPFYLVGFRGLQNDVAGLSLAFYPLGIASGSAIAGRLLSRMAAPWMPIAAMLLLVAGLGSIARWSTGTPLPFIWLGLLAAGGSLGAFHVAYGHYITGVYGVGERGVAGALVEFTRTVGILVAALTLFPLFEYMKALSSGAGGEAAFQYGFGATFGAMAAIPAVLLAFAGIWSVSGLGRR